MCYTAKGQEDWPRDVVAACVEKCRKKTMGFGDLDDTARKAACLLGLGRSREVMGTRLK